MLIYGCVPFQVSIASRTPSCVRVTQNGLSGVVGSSGPKTVCKITSPKHQQDEPSRVIDSATNVAMHFTARAARAHTRPQELPFLVDGIETEMDRFLLDHFVRKACTVLTMLNEDANPFKVLLLPMAIRHRGLMHSLLCFSGSHLASSDRQQVAERQVYHYQRAIEELRTDTKLDDYAHGRSHEPIDDPTIATALVLCLDTICSGATDGQYRPHLEAARFLIQTQATQDRAFGEFLVEFFTFHDTASALTALDRRPVMLNDDFPLPRFIIQRDKEDRAFVGVFDGLFDLISRVTQLRDTVRERRTLELEPAVDYQALCDAVSLDCAIRSWVCPHREGSPRYIAAQLYRQCTWIYLWRTVHPSRRTEKIVAAVEEGLSYVRQLPPDASSQSILLMPVFMLSTAAFLRDQRPELRKAFGTLKRYSNLRNIEAAREVVERLWSIMDAGEEAPEDGSWDWEAIMKDMGYDFLVT